MGSTVLATFNIGADVCLSPRNVLWYWIPSPHPGIRSDGREPQTALKAISNDIHSVVRREIQGSRK